MAGNGTRAEALREAFGAGGRRALRRQAQDSGAGADKLRDLNRLAGEEVHIALALALIPGLPQPAARGQMAPGNLPGENIYSPNMIAKLNVFTNTPIVRFLWLCPASPSLPA